MIKCPVCEEIFEEADLKQVLTCRGMFHGLLQIEPNEYIDVCPHCDYEILDYDVGEICQHCEEFYTGETSITGYCNNCIELEMEK